VKVILVPIDFTPVTKRVVAEAAALAREHGARMVLLNVTTRRLEFANHDSLVKTIAGFESGEVNGKPKNSRRARDGAAVKPIQGASLQLIGKPVEVILEQAAKLSADYIVIGSHSHTALHELVIGSTTGGVLKGAECPVVVVPPNKPISTAARRRRVRRLAAGRTGVVTSARIRQQAMAGKMSRFV
jgi:nucleotide-binding universal stress UspA family protein